MILTLNYDRGVIRINSDEFFPAPKTQIKRLYKIWGYSYKERFEWSELKRILEELIDREKERQAAGSRVIVHYQKEIDWIESPGRWITKDLKKKLKTYKGYVSEAKGDIKRAESRIKKLKANIEEVESYDE